MKKLLGLVFWVGVQGCGGCVESNPDQQPANAPAETAQPSHPTGTQQHGNPRFMRSPVLERVHAADAQAD